MIRKTALLADTVRRSSSRKRGGGERGTSDGSETGGGGASSSAGAPDPRQRSQSQPRSHPSSAAQPHPPPPPPPMPPSVASLTSKNYRLAKELSELRVRHREECKKQTRLSMENMTLSSKYRDAMKQVAHLTREVAYYQRRTETLAAAATANSNTKGLGSKGVPSTAPASNSAATSNITTSPVGGPPPSPTAAVVSALTPRKQASVLAEVVAEMNRMDRILADHAKRSAVAAAENATGAGTGGSERPPKAAASVIASLPSLPSPPVRCESPPTSSTTAPPAMAPEAAAAAAATAASPSSPASSSSSSSLFLSDFPSPLPPFSSGDDATADAAAAASELVSSDEFEADLELLARGCPPADDGDNDLANADKETKEADWEPTVPSTKRAGSSASEATATASTTIIHRSPVRETKSSSSFFPHSASPKFRFNEEYPGDIAAPSSVRGMTTAKVAPRPVIAEGPDELQEDDEGEGDGEQPAQVSPPSTASSLPPSCSNGAVADESALRKRLPSSTSSSIDAFEASFFTSFPVSFPTKDSAPSAAGRATQREDIYNPFVQSPVPKDDWRGPLQSASLLEQHAIAATAPALQSAATPSPSSSDHTGQQRPPRRKSPVTAEPPRGSLLSPFHPGGLNKVVPVNEDPLMSATLNVTTSTSSRSPLASSGAFLFQTPPPPPAPTNVSSTENGSPTPVTAAATGPFRFSTPPPPTHSHSSPSNNESGGNSIGVNVNAQPKRPEKAGHEIARARREKVLQPRSAGSLQSPVTPPLQPVLTPVSGTSTAKTPSPSPKPTFTGSGSGSNSRRVKGLLDPNSREAILLSARERLSASLAMSNSSGSTSSLIAPYSTPPSSQRAFSENHLNLHHSSSKHEAAVLWGESVYDDDGDIPLRSSLTKNVDVRIRVESTKSGSPSLPASQLPPQRTLWHDDSDKDFNDDGSETGPSNSPRLSKATRPRRPSPPSAVLSSSLAFQHSSATSRPPEALLR